MRRIVIVLIALFSLAGTANAQSSSIGLRVGLFDLVTVFYGYDFEAPNRGFGMRVFVSLTAVVTFGGASPFPVFVGIEGFYRIPLDIYASNVQVGIGASAVAGGQTPMFFTYLQLGLEVALGAGWGLVLETKPLNYMYVTQFQYYPWSVFSLGLNHRF